MSNYTWEDIWIYIYDHKNVRAYELEKAFLSSGVKNANKSISRGTLYRYKRYLLDQKYIGEKRIEEKHGPPRFTFHVPKRYVATVVHLRAKKKAESILQNMTIKNLDRFFNIWPEIEMVIQEMTKMGYADQEITNIIGEGFEKIHSNLVDRIVKDGENQADLL
jgi:hypothetical protein